MKSIKVNIEAKTVSVFNEKKQTWETCNFYEAGLEPSGEVITDEDEIIEHLTERHGVGADEIEIG